MKSVIFSILFLAISGFIGWGVGQLHGMYPSVFAFIGGVLCVILGVFAAGWVFSMIEKGMDVGK